MHLQNDFYFDNEKGKINYYNKYINYFQLIVSYIIFIRKKFFLWEIYFRKNNNANNLQSRLQRNNLFSYNIY